MSMPRLAPPSMTVVRWAQSARAQVIVGPKPSRRLADLGKAHMAALDGGELAHKLYELPRETRHLQAHARAIPRVYSRRRAAHFALRAEPTRHTSA